MEFEPTEYYHRYKDRVELEPDFGEFWLRASYDTPFGFFLRIVAVRSIYANLVSRFMRSKASRGLIRRFVEKFELDAGEFDRPIEKYEDFNEFYCRKLRPGARRVFSDPDAVVFPADGRHFGWQDFSEANGIYVKGEVFTLEELFNDAAMASYFAHGTLILSRLCPTDYHRFHFPATLRPNIPRLVNGKLFSLHPLALRWNISVLGKNKRALTLMESKRLGKVVMVEVGGSQYGTLVQTYRFGQVHEAGMEKGYFAYGGSTVVTVFEPGRIQLADDLMIQTNKRRELYARMGDLMGIRNP